MTASKQEEMTNVWAADFGGKEVRVFRMLSKSAASASGRL
jgi:hypothetical protein